MLREEQRVHLPPRPATHPLSPPLLSHTISPARVLRTQIRRASALSRARHPNFPHYAFNSKCTGALAHPSALRSSWFAQSRERSKFRERSRRNRSPRASIPVISRAIAINVDAVTDVAPSTSRRRDRAFDVPAEGERKPFPFRREANYMTASKFARPCHFFRRARAIRYILRRDATAFSGGGMRREFLKTGRLFGRDLRTDLASVARLPT